MNDRCPDQVLFKPRTLFISIAWTMVLFNSSPSFHLYISPHSIFPCAHLPAILVYFFSFHATTLSIRVLLRTFNEQPLDKPSDLYEDYVDLLLESIASKGTTGSSVEKRRWDFGNSNDPAPGPSCIPDPISQDIIFLYFISMLSQRMLYYWYYRARCFDAYEYLWFISFFFVNYFETILASTNIHRRP